MLHDNPQFVAAVRKIISESLGTKSSIDPDQAQQDSNNERDDAPIATVSELRTEIPIRIETEPEKSKAKRIGKVMFSILEVFGILAVIVYTVLANRQWHEMISARHQAEIAIKAAQDTLKETHQNFIADERPFLWLPNAHTAEDASFSTMTYNKTTQKLAWNLQIKNFGKSPAIQMSLDIHLAVGKNALQTAQHYNPTVGKIMGAPIAPGDFSVATAWYEGTISPQKLEQLRSIEGGVVAYGYAEYADRYSKEGERPYSFTFCFYTQTGGLSGYCTFNNDIH